MILFVMGYYGKMSLFTSSVLVQVWRHDIKQDDTLQNSLLTVLLSVVLFNDVAPYTGAYSLNHHTFGLYYKNTTDSC